MTKTETKEEIKKYSFPMLSDSDDFTVGEHLSITLRMVMQLSVGDPELRSGGGGWTLRCPGNPAHSTKAGGSGGLRDLPQEYF